MTTAPRCLAVVMGVSGCGKTTVGRLLAQRIGAEFLEGDELHPKRNVQRMSTGIALNDVDRRGWLLAIAARLADANASNTSLVVACSALKRSYRDLLRLGAADLVFVHLHGERALLESRLRQRKGHYMPASLLDSQFATLEPPHGDERTVSLDVAPAPETIADRTADGLRALGAVTLDASR